MKFAKNLVQFLAQSMWKLGLKVFERSSGQAVEERGLARSKWLCFA